MTETFLPFELPGWLGPVFRAEIADSTNAEALRRPADELPTAPPAAVFWALEQTGGRGRLGRKWESPAARGLMVTIAYPHVTDLDRLGWLHMAAAAAVMSAIETLAGPIPGMGIKWPNDVVILPQPPGAPTAEPDDASIAYRKLCGILTETADEVRGVGRRAALGIGVNVNHRRDEFPAEFRQRATSLFLETGREWNLESLLLEILMQMERRDRVLRDGNFAAIRDEVAACSVLDNRRVTLEYPGRSIDGIARGIDATGRLLLDRLDTGERLAIDAGEITRIR